MHIEWCLADRFLETIIRPRSVCLVLAKNVVSYYSRVWQSLPVRNCAVCTFWPVGLRHGRLFSGPWTLAWSMRLMRLFLNSQELVLRKKWPQGKEVVLSLVLVLGRHRFPWFFWLSDTHFRYSVDEVPQTRIGADHENPRSIYFSMLGTKSY